MNITALTLQHPTTRTKLWVCVVFVLASVRMVLSKVEFIELEEGICTTRSRWHGGEGECLLATGEREDIPFCTSCEDKNKEERFLIVLVISARHHFTHRQTIRKTWASRYDSKEYGSSTYRIFFVIGNATTREDKFGAVSSRLEAEHGTYNDMIRVPVIDTYSNLIYKILLAFDYVEKRFKYNYLMKVDDDTFVHLEPLLLDLQHPKRRRTKKFVQGQIWAGVPIRDDKHKNFVSKTYYPLDQLLPYPHGAHYVVTRDFVSYIVRNEDMLASSIVPPEHRGNIEDVRMGLWAFAIGMTFVHDTRFVETINCHKNAISLSDVPLNLFKSIFTRLRGFSLGRIKNSTKDVGSICTDDVHAHAAERYFSIAQKIEQEKESSMKDPARYYEKLGNAFNNAAVHSAYISKFKVAAEMLQKAKDAYDNVGIGGKVLKSLEYLRNLASGDTACDMECVENLRNSLDIGLEEFAHEISKP
eukprot:g10742.t1